VNNKQLQQFVDLKRLSGYPGFDDSPQSLQLRLIDNRRDNSVRAGTRAEQKHQHPALPEYDAFEEKNLFILVIPFYRKC
jgi:hypothetical protein